METFHILHLAASWKQPSNSIPSTEPPLTTSPVKPDIFAPTSSDQALTNVTYEITEDPPVIRAAALHIVFASRASQEFITPEKVIELEAWGGLGVLEAICKYPIPEKACILCTR